MSTAAAAYHRHDISDRGLAKSWNPASPAAPAKWDARRRTTAASSTPCSGCCAPAPPGATCPPDYGDWGNTHRRFIRWRNKNVWAELQEALVDDPDFEWLMIDASYIKVHQHGTGARGGNQAVGRTKGG